MENDQPLTPDLHKQIDTLCRQISIAHHLDPDLQSELRAHLEDKTRAYLTGQLPLSEADALLLAKSHFGNPAQIKSLFQSVHATAHTLSFARRIVAIIAATFAVDLLSHAFAGFWKLYVLYPASIVPPPERYAALPYVPRPQFSETFHALLVTGQTLNCILQVGTLWVLLHLWRTQLSRGNRRWFDTPTPLRATATLVLLCAIQFALSVIVSRHVWDAAPPYSNGAQFAEQSFLVATTISWLIALAAQAFLWIWWLDRTPRTRRSSLLSAACWLLYNQSYSVLSAAFWTILAFTHSSINGSTMASSLFRNILYGTTRHSTVGFLALIPYILITRHRDKNHPPISPPGATA